MLATWRMLLDLGRGQDDEPHLAGDRPRHRWPGSRRPRRPRSAPPTATCSTVATDRGSITLPLAITTPMPDGVVWVPANSAGSRVRTALAADAGDRVRVARATATTDQEADA